MEKEEELLIQNKDEIIKQVSSRKLRSQKLQKVILTKEKVPTDFKKQGRRNRVNGGIIERKVRADLEKKGWIVNKWMNNVDLIENKLSPSKRKFNPFSKVMTIGTGFPDFICFKKEGESFNVILVEVKRNGIFDKDEKEKAKWYLENNIIKEILIAMEEKNGKKLAIKYIDFKEKYPKVLI